MSENPLKKHFRKPEIFITLPSNGKYWPAGSLHLPASGEIPILSMTAIDELYLLTPDALINGDAIAKMIENCAPNIVNAWDCPSIDLETILVAIRIASVGEKLSIESTCPTCSEAHEYDIDLKSLVLQEDPLIWSKNLEINELIFKFSPPSFLQTNNYNQKLFEVRKRLQQVPEIEDNDAKETITNQIMNEFNLLDLNLLVECILSICTEECEVVDKEFISEFINNCDKKIYSKLRTHVEKLKDSTKFKDVLIDCADCSHQYTTSISLDYTSFFELGS